MAMKIFRDELRERDFVVTAECFLKPETDAASIRYQADTLRDSVDGIVLTDNQHGQTHMSTIAAARLMLDNDVDPIVQLSCRNRNRIALVADMLGACALGVSSLLLVRGRRVPEAITPRPKRVLDMKVAELVASAAALKSDERLKPAADLFIGSTVTSHAPKADWVPEKITSKVDAGTQFLLVSANMDMRVLRNYMNHLVAAKLTRRVMVIVSSLILTSADDARWLRDRRANIRIPDSVVHRLENASDPREEGLAMCAEHLSQLVTVPGVSGANIIASTDLAMIPEVISAADLGKD
jgi:methylenetetrahydrofolate reductase (NADPH)